MVLNVCRMPTLLMFILRERWHASRLPSLRSALRGLDPRHALPILYAFIGASARVTVCSALDHMERPTSALQ